VDHTEEAKSLIEALQAASSPLPSPEEEAQEAGERSMYEGEASLAQLYKGEASLASLRPGGGASLKELPPAWLQERPPSSTKSPPVPAVPSNRPSSSARKELTTPCPLGSGWRRPPSGGPPQETFPVVPEAIVSEEPESPVVRACRRYQEVEKSLVAESKLIYSPGVGKPGRAGRAARSPGPLLSPEGGPSLVGEESMIGMSTFKFEEARGLGDTYQPPPPGQDGVPPGGRAMDDLLAQFAALEPVPGDSPKCLARQLLSPALGQEPGSPRGVSPRGSSSPSCRGGAGGASVRQSLHSESLFLGK